MFLQGAQITGQESLIKTWTAIVPLPVRHLDILYLHILMGKPIIK